ncbi:hypothetical protein [Streptomyces sp. NPDC001436]
MAVNVAQPAQAGQPVAEVTHHRATPGHGFATALAGGRVLPECRVRPSPLCDTCREEREVQDGI